MKRIVPIKWRFAIVLAIIVPTHGFSETWPSDEWNRNYQSHSTSLQLFENYAFPKRNDNKEGIRTDALLVVKGGEIVYERYEAPYSLSTPHLLWSASKSVFACVMGIAQQQKRLQLDDPVALHVKEMNDHPKVRVRDLLYWSSGIEWREDYQNPILSSAIAMLYTIGSSDMPQYVSSFPQRNEPGTQYHYSSGDSNLLSATLRGALSPEDYRHYPWKALFDPLGIKSATWEQDKAGNWIASSYLYLSAQDLARIGLMVSRGGRWQQTRLLENEWLKTMLTVAPNPKRIDGKPLPGGHWWLNVQDANKQIPWPAVPESTVAMLGHWGQSMYVLPEHDLVIVRYADDRDSTYSHNQLLKLAMDTFVEKTP